MVERDLFGIFGQQAVRTKPAPPALVLELARHLGAAPAHVEADLQAEHHRMHLDSCRFDACERATRRLASDDLPHRDRGDLEVRGKVSGVRVCEVAPLDP